MIPPLNLLPPERRAFLAAKRRLRRTRRVSLTVLAASALAVALTYGGRMLYEQRTEAVAAETTALLQELDRNDLKALAATVSGINDRTKLLTGVAPRDTRWAAFLTDLLRAVPSGIRLTALTVDQRTREISFAGTAATREDLLRFQSAMTTGGFLDRFDTPLTGLSKPTEIAFPSVTAHVPAATLASYLRTP